MHEAAHARSMVASAEVVETGLAVEEFAGEVKRARVVAGAGGGHAIAKGEAGDGFADNIVLVVGAHALGAKPIGVAEVGAATVFSDVTATSAPPLPGRLFT